MGCFPVVLRLALLGERKLDYHLLLFLQQGGGAGLKLIMKSFGDVPLFLQGSDMPHATTSKLLEIIQDAVKCRKLKMELAATIDAMEPFVKACYIPEGDGALALVAYEHISTLYAVVSSDHYPNVAAVARHLSGGDSMREQQLVAYAKACYQPAYNYFKVKFDNELKPSLLTFKTARYFVPSKITEFKPTASDIDSLCCFLSITSLHSLMISNLSCLCI